MRLIRASIRGSIRNVIVTDSEASELPATAASIRRTSGLFSAQKSASASSLSKIGTSSHFPIARIFVHCPRRRFRSASSPGRLAVETDDEGSRSLRQILVHLPLIEESFLRLKGPRKDDADLFAVRAIHAKDASAVDGHAQVEKPGLDRKPRGVR